MKILSWNVNGIKAIEKKGFEKFVEKEKPDILLLQEIKGVEKDLPKIKGYKAFINSSERKKGYAGTAVYFRLNKLRIKSAKNGIGNRRFEKEGRVITLELKDFYVIDVYVPNSGRGLPRLDFRKDWDKALLSYLKNLSKKKPLVIGGDFNVAHQEIDLARPKQNYNKTAGYTQDEIDGFKKFLDSGFIDTFREKNPKARQYSYWSYMFNARKKNIGWRIDYFLASKEIGKKIKKAFILDKVEGSDHCPVGIEIK